MFLCFLGGCSNEASSASSVWEENCALHKFPDRKKDRRRHDSWVQFVRNTRDIAWTASTTSRICSKHFRDDMFANKMEFLMKASQNMQCLLLLNRHAVPTITSQPKPPQTATPRDSRSQKRLVTELVQNAVSIEPDDEDDSSDDEWLEFDSDSVCEADEPREYDPTWEP